MAIRYSDLSDVKISDRGISISEVNTAITKMIENDNAMQMNGGNAPSVWECRWYNDRANAETYGYNVGDAVWMNTENIDDFIKTHEGDITNYIVKNTQLRFVYSQVSSSYNEKMAMFKDIVTGNGYENLGPLYWLGDIHDTVQIRISLVDNNITTPDNDEYWKDFFNIMTDDDVRLSIDNAFNDELSTQMDEHMVEFHLSGLQMDESELFSRYLAKDMSNVQDIQQFAKTHKYATDMIGFDDVLLFKRITTPNRKSYKWFRLWSSGLLEHGGFIDKDEMFQSDSFAYDNTHLSIDLDWIYDNNIHAPVFDYAIASLDGFYEISPKCMTQSDDQPFVIDETMNLPSVYRYVSNTSIVMSDEPYSVMNMTDVMPYYDTQLVDTLKNNSICVKSGNSDKMYSYYVKGYTYTNRRKY